MPLPSIQPFMSCAFRFEANPVNASQLIPVIVGSLPLGSLRCSVMSSSLEWLIPTFGLFGARIHHIISHLLSFIVHHFLGMCSPQLQLVDCQHHTWLATDALNHAVRCSTCTLFDLIKAALSAVAMRYQIVGGLDPVLHARALLDVQGSCMMTRRRWIFKWNLRQNPAEGISLNAVFSMQKQLTTCSHIIHIYRNLFNI